MPEATDNSKGLMSAYKSLYTNKNIASVGQTTRYVKIISMNALNAEGMDSHFSLIIAGGNGYTWYPAVHIVSGYSHRGSEAFSKKDQNGVNVNFGYVDNGGSIDVYVECIAYNHAIRVLPLSLGNNTKILNEYVTSKPSGWVDI